MTSAMVQGKKLLEVVFLSFMLMLSTSVNSADEENTDAIYNSLSKQYKPVNKRNVWHHTMFKLRREMQAIAESNNNADTQHWVSRFSKDYKKIAKMVPEWESELDLLNLKLLEKAAIDNDKSQINESLREIKRNCRACHIDYRANVAAIFRAPDFSKLQLKNHKGEAKSYRRSMIQLTEQLNRIKIGLIEKDQEKSIQALTDLRAGMQHLENSCSSCHKDDEARQFYLGEKSKNLLNDLQKGIENNDDIKDVGRTLGLLAVRSCARCHGVHRIVYDITKDKKNEKDIN